MDYFKQLPSINYGNTYIANITQLYMLTENIDDRFLADYEINGIKSLEEISLEVYNTTEHWWIIALINNITDVIFDIPIDDQIIRDIAADISTTEIEKIDNIELLLNENDDKAVIKILDPSKINEFLTKITKLSNNESSEEKILTDLTYTAISEEDYLSFMNNSKKYIGYDNKVKTI